MHKLFKLTFLFLFVITACFLTGCGNTSDDWGKKHDDNPKTLLVSIGFYQPVAEIRAAFEMPASIEVFTGSRRDSFKKEKVSGLVTVYSGILSETDVNSVKNYGLTVTFNSLKFKISGTYLNMTYIEGKGQPTAYVITKNDFSGAEKVYSNGNEVAPTDIVIPEPVSHKVILTLSSDKNSIRASFDNLGNVKSYNWHVKVDDITDPEHKVTHNIYSGASAYFSVESYGPNHFVLSLTEAGQNELKGKTCNGQLVSASAVLFDNQVIDLDCSDASCSITDYTR